MQIVAKRRWGWVLISNNIDCLSKTVTRKEENKYLSEDKQRIEKQQRKVNETKSCLFVKFNKTDKPLTKLTNRKRGDSNN